MSRCEDYPCCGHEPGGCPDPDGRFRCARCGARLPKRATSAVCARCHADWRRAWAQGEDDRADRADGDLALRDAPAEEREIRGSELHPDDQRHVLAAWCHRYTREHRPEWAECLRPDGVAYRAQFASDADWLAHTWFRVTAAGRLDMGEKECRSEPTWPDGAPEYPKEALALREGPAAAPAAPGRGRRGVVVPASLLCAEDQTRVLGRTWVQIGADGRMLDGGQRWVPTGAPIGEAGDWALER